MTVDSYQRSTNSKFSRFVIPEAPVHSALFVHLLHFVFDNF